MLAPELTADDFLAVLQAFLPRGRVWPRDSDAIQTRTLAGCAPTYVRQTARANNLLTDGFPASTYELLPDWEASLGLPDPCAGESPSLQQRRSQVVARFSNRGGQSSAYFIGLAAELGYDVSIENFAPARAGRARCGDADCGKDWAFAWSVKSPLSAVTYARAGQSTAGEPLVSWGNDVLQCELEALKPAQSVLIFRYITEIFDNSVVDDFDHPVVTSDGLPVVI